MPKKRFFKFEPAVFNKLYNDFELNANNTGDETAESKDDFQGSENTLTRRNFAGFSF